MSEERGEIEICNLQTEIAGVTRTFLAKPITIHEGDQVAIVIDATGRPVGVEVQTPEGRVITRVMDDGVQTKDGAA